MKSHKGKGERLIVARKSETKEAPKEKQKGLQIDRDARGIEKTEDV